MGAFSELRTQAMKKRDKQSQRITEEYEEQTTRDGQPSFCRNEEREH